MNWLQLATEAVEEHKSMQKPTELAALLELLERRPPKNLVEIGSNYGGTTWALSYLIDSIVCVDNETLEGRMQAAEDVDYALVCGDSGDPETRDQALAVLGDPVDLLFIDGDHRSDAVRRDLRVWKLAMAEDGLMVFHDICHRRLPDHDMWQFWDQIRQAHPCLEIYDPGVGWGGIGVLPVSPLSPLLAPNQPLPLCCCRGGALEPPEHCMAMQSE